MHSKNCKISAIISCFYNADPPAIPVGFDWANVLSTEFAKKYRITILLHGQNIPYGLQDDVYEAKFGTPNPYLDYLKMLCRQGVKIKICELCLNKDGFKNSDLLKFVKPVKFSVDFLAESDKKGKSVIYDAQLPIA